MIMMPIIIIIIIIIITASYESSVFVMIGKGLGDQRIVVRIPSRVTQFFFLPNTKICPKIYSDSYKVGNGASFLGVKRPGMKITNYLYLKVMYGDISQ
jgi:hypothetical protein